ncbi:hypothetical protein [Streptomyces sp. KR55]|uniref:hypothetical protein n=1 Tax=Streptomyces sp. KR55 TaxID=3457425 RepID=UPI003FD231BA
MDEQQYLDAATAVRPHLDALLGDGAGDVRRRLDELLARACAGEPVRTGILRVLSAHEPTRRWTQEYLATEPGLREFAAPLGDVRIPRVPSFVCVRPGCDTVWYRFSVSMPIPECHGSPLVRRTPGGTQPTADG